MNRLQSVTAGVVLIAAATSAFAGGLVNGDFEATPADQPPAGWRLFDATGQALDPRSGPISVDKSGGVEGSSALRFSPPAGAFINAGQEVSGIKAGERVLVECQVRCEKLRRYAGLWLMGVGSGEYIEADRSAVRGTAGWRRIYAQFVAGDGCRGVRVKLGAMGPGTVWFDDVRLYTGEDAKRALDSLPPNLAEANWGLFQLQGRCRATVQWPGLEQEIAFPIPIIMDGQCPLSFEVRTEPADVLKSVIFEHRGGPNWVARATFVPPEGCESFEISTDSIVLATKRDYSDLDLSTELDAYRKRGAIPEDARLWLGASASVQSKDGRIRAFGRKAAKDAETLSDLLKGIQRVLRDVRAGYPGPEYAIEWDAVTALKKRTGCCGDANLAAAVFRACRVPARILAGHPPRSGPHATHYVVEYYVPGFGWAIFEASSLSNLYHPCQQIEVSQVTPADETAGVRRVGIGQPAFWRGTPLHSTPELLGAPDPASAVLRVEGAIPIPGGDGHSCVHQVTLHRKFEEGASPSEQQSLLKLATDRWLCLLADASPQALGERQGLSEAVGAKDLRGRLETALEGR